MKSTDWLLHSILWLWAVIKGAFSQLSGALNRTKIFRKDHASTQAYTDIEPYRFYNIERQEQIYLKYQFWLHLLRDVGFCRFFWPWLWRIADAASGDIMRFCCLKLACWKILFDVLNIMKFRIFTLECKKHPIQLSSLIIGRCFRRVGNRAADRKQVKEDK